MSQTVKKLFLFTLFFLLSFSALAQKTIEGTITNAETGGVLPTANIIIQDVYQGTVSNRLGRYRLSIPDSLLPATIEVSFIGFHSKKRTITANSTAEQNFELIPSVAELQELTVTADKSDLSIMELVIRRKQQWRENLRTYKADAYSRQTLSNDTAIVSITESLSTLFWDEGKGHREVLKWRRQTANIEAVQNFAGVSYLPNLYDDNIVIAGFKLVGVTHPEAPEYYNFEVLDLLSIDGQTVYKIKVKPNRTLQPLFTGVVYVLDEEYALLRVELSPNDVVRFPTPIKDFDLNYQQQFNNFGGDFWLPVNVRIKGELKIEMLGLEFPQMKFRQLARLTDYEVNVPLPDSLYKEDNLFTIDSTAAGSDSLLVESLERVPLTPEEKLAYASIDSSNTFAEAFEPTGFLARFIDFSVSVEVEGQADSTRKDSMTVQNTDGGLNIATQFSPRLRFNRVDGLYGGLAFKIAPVDPLTFEFEGGYSTNYKEWSYGAGLQYSFPGRLNPQVGMVYRANTAPRYSSIIFNPTMTSIPNILGYPNYFDYFRNEGFELFTKFTDSQTDLSWQAAFVSKEQTSITTETAYDILARNHRVRPNPAIHEGHLNSVKLELGYNLDENYSYGITGLKQISLEIEYSDDALGSDYKFTRYETNIFWSFETFLQRRLFPNTLHIRFSGGTFSGRLPLQKFGIVDVAEGFFSPFGVLRTVRFRPYEGEQYAALHVEHNFRTVPFELLGLDWVADQDIGVIGFISAAQTWISDTRMERITDRTDYIPKTTDGLHLEAGLSLNGILSLFRVDFAYRIDDPGLFVGVSLTRFL